MITETPNFEFLLFINYFYAFQYAAAKSIYTDIIEFIHKVASDKKSINDGSCKKCKLICFDILCFPFINGTLTVGTDLFF